MSNDAKIELIPIPTRILTDKDNIIDTVERYTKDKIGSDDVISVAESVVAITQGRAVRPEDLKITKVAKFCCRFIPDYGSLATPHGMQSLMDVEGKWRVAAALFVGFLGKLIGLNGLFTSGAVSRQPLSMMLLVQCLHLISISFMGQRILIRWLNS